MGSSPIRSTSGGFRLIQPHIPPDHLGFNLMMRCFLQSWGSMLWSFDHHAFGMLSNPKKQFLLIQIFTRNHLEELGPPKWRRF